MTPTLGTRTGVGNSVAHVYSSLSTNESIQLVPYTLSYKARGYKDELPADNVFIPYPARVLLTAWKYSRIFSLDGALGDINLWHATNYLAPPTSHPLVITIHDVTMVKYPELVSPQVRTLAPMIHKRLSSGAHVHVPSHAIRNDVLEHFSGSIQDESHVHVVPFALPDLTEGIPSPSIKKLCDGDPIIVCIGALEPRKNHARLIEAFESVYEKFPHIRLVLVGPDGPARPAIDTARAQLSHNARDRVVITGKVSDVDRTHLLKSAAVVAYPSLYEGFGFPLLEAMHAHSPIVTSQEGSLEEVAGDAAQFVDAYNVDSIAQGIIDVLTSTELRDKLIANGLARADDFSWERTALSMADMYTHIVQQGS